MLSRSPYSFGQKVNSPPKFEVLLHPCYYLYLYYFWCCHGFTIKPGMNNNHISLQSFFLLSDMAMKTCHLAAFSSLFYDISDLHTILPWLEYDPVMSQQCTPFKFEVEAASVDMLELYFHLGPSINSNAFVNDTCCLLPAWHFERIYAVRYNPYSKTSIRWFSF